MAFCPKCGNQLDENVKFCSVCGEPTGAQQPAAPTYTAPQQPYQAPQQPYQAPYQAPYQQPYQAPYQQPYQAPEVSGGDKAKGFVGMALSILGMVIAVIGLIVTMAFFSNTSDWYDDATFTMALTYCIFTLPLGIVGKVLGTTSANNGNTSGACGAASGLGLATIIISGVMLFFGFISLIN